jgi:hypothetical protein
VVVTLLCIIPNTVGMKLMQNKLNLFLETGETYKERLRGTIGYMSPELILTGRLLTVCACTCVTAQCLTHPWSWNVICITSVQVFKCVWCVLLRWLRVVRKCCVLAP